jgi:hypothetical protein
LKAVNYSDLVNHLSSSNTTNGAAYRSSILKWWPPNTEKKKFFDQLTGHTEDGGLNVLSGGIIGMQGRQRNVSICKVQPVMGNPNVLRALYEELMLITLYLPVPGQFFG